MIDQTLMVIITYSISLCSFRHSLNMPRSSLPLVVARACVRVGRPEVVMSYVRDEVQYGLFPSTRVYNVIMDAMLKKKKPKGVWRLCTQIDVVCLCVCVQGRCLC